MVRPKESAAEMVHSDMQMNTKGIIDCPETKSQIYFKDGKGMQ